MPKTNQIIERLHNKIIKCASACRWRISYVIVWLVWWWWRVYFHIIFSFPFFVPSLRALRVPKKKKNENVLPLFSFFDSHSDSVALSHFAAVEALFPFWYSAVRWKYAKRSSTIISLLGIISFALCPYTGTGTFAQTSRRREYTKYSQTRNERRHIDAVMVFFSLALFAINSVALV